MISLVQIQLLEEKVESAVAKILQLTKENEELTQRCSQLEDENARLQDNLLNFHQDQERIEQGIIKALDKLNVVENSVLQAVGIQDQLEENQESAIEVQPPAISEAVESQPEFNKEEPIYSQKTYSEESPTLQVPSENPGLAPMFSEEVVENSVDYSEEEKPQQVQELELGFQVPQNDNLFAQNQDDQNSGQLDIF